MCNPNSFERQLRSSLGLDVVLSRCYQCIIQYLVGRLFERALRTFESLNFSSGS